MSVICINHPKYKGKNRKRSKYCAACHLLYILRWQNTNKAEQKLGGLNPYQFIECGLEDACLNIKIIN